MTRTTGTPRTPGAVWSLLFLLCAFTFSGRALAHDPNVSGGKYALVDGEVRAELSFGHNDFPALGRAMGFAEAWSKTGDIDEMAAALVEEGFEVKAGDAGCPGRVNASIVANESFDIDARFACPKGAERARVAVVLLAKLNGHNHIVQREGAAPLTIDADTATFDLTAPGVVPAEEDGPSGFFGFLKSGVEHILFGFDHLVFLFGLVLVGRRFKGIFWAVTAFTLAHSVTLALAVLGIWAPSGDIIEPLIALSVAYVGVENFYVKDADKRWRITLPFGLVHGFGFAGALGEIKLPAAEIPPALLAFNLGVEMGQLAVLGVLLPILLTLHKKTWFEKDDRAVRVLSGVVIALGLFWFVERIVGIIRS